MARVLWTPTAEQNLDGIFDYIGTEHHSPATAAKFLRRIRDRCSLQATQPGMGEARPDLAPDVRCFPVGNYVVIYRPLPDGIEVLLVTHGARDIPALYRRLFG